MCLPNKERSRHQNMVRQIHLVQQFYGWIPGKFDVIIKTIIECFFLLITTAFLFYYKNSAAIHKGWVSLCKSTIHLQLS